MLDNIKKVDSDFKNLVEVLLANTQEYLDAVPDTFVSKDHRYPLVMAYPLSTTRTDGNKDVVFNVRVMSILYENLKLIDILNDMDLITDEIIAYFNERQDDTRWYAVVASNPKSFAMGIDDTCGWEFQLTFKLRNPVDYNQIRFK
jgi:hypothetical protein